MLNVKTWMVGAGAIALLAGAGAGVALADGGADDARRAPAPVSTPGDAGLTASPSGPSTYAPRTPGGATDDDGGARDRDHRVEPGDDRGSRTAEPGDDNGGALDRDDRVEPGDDRDYRTAEPGDDNGGTGDDSDDDGSGEGSGDRSGHGGGGSDDD